MRETLQWILQRIILLIKKVSGWQGILVSGLLIKAVRNNDIMTLPNGAILIK